jgi:hypothetical protein
MVSRTCRNAACGDGAKFGSYPESRPVGRRFRAASGTCGALSSELCVESTFLVLHNGALRSERDDRIDARGAIRWAE